MPPAEQGGEAQMALEAVEEVNRAEEEARKIIADAQDGAKTLLAEAEHAGRAALDTARAKAQAETEQAMEVARTKGAAAGESVLLRAKKDAADQVAEAKGHMDAAAAGIVAKIRGGEGD